MRQNGKEVPAVRPPLGMTSALEFALEFQDWATRPGQAVTREAIQNRWDVSRATAYRYLAAWRATQERRTA